MKKTIILLSFFAFAFSTNAQGTKSVNEELKKVDAQIAKAKADALADVSKKASADTLDVSPSVKFIKINNMLIPTAAFSQSVPVFLSAEAWLAVIEIINTRKYGDIPATTINEIIESIFIQVKQKGKQ